MTDNLKVKGVESVLLGSGNSKQLADFYKDKVGLKLTTEATMGEGDEATDVYGFDMENGTGLYIMNHSEVHGKNNMPGRVMLNIEVVGQIEEAVEQLKGRGVEMVGELHHVEGYGKIATFEDPDGNYFQLVQVKEI